MAAAQHRVFISSTFQDLAEHREALAAAIRDLGGLPVSGENFDFGVEPLWNRIRKEIDDSDAVVMLVGHRYGSVDPKTGKGWIEAEYETIRQLSKPLIVFLADDKAKWPVRLVDSDRENIRHFRERLLTDSVVRFFSSVDDLKSAAISALSQFFHSIDRPRAPDAKGQLDNRDVRIVRLLLSSPGDVAEERQRVEKAVFRYNQQYVEERGIFIKVVRWEDMAPQIGPRPQDVINKQIGKYDIFAGIMWNRFGTPTEIAASGTKEEFDGALNSWRSTGKPWVTFYFCDRPANFINSQQLEQKRRVVEFRAELQGNGIVRSYLGTDEFEEMAFRDLVRITAHPEFQGGGR